MLCNAFDCNFTAAGNPRLNPAQFESFARVGNQFTARIQVKSPAIFCSRQIGAIFAKLDAGRSDSGRGLLPVRFFALFRPAITESAAGKSERTIIMMSTIELKRATPLLLITLALFCLGLLPKAQAVEPAAPNTALPGGNTADGQLALGSVTTGLYNSAFGIFSLLSLTDGNFCTGVGAGTLLSNTQGGSNTATGEFALFDNTEGNFNTAVGNDALDSNTTGSNNVALGNFAGASVVTANNVIAIGTGGADVDNSCFIGNIRDVTTANNDAVPVVIDSASQLGTVSSSRRFKKEIEPMEKASEAILALKPVTFHYKSDRASRPQFGLIAEEVAEVNPDLVVRDKNGEIYTVRYDAVNAMLLNEFLKAHRAMEEQRKEIDTLKTQLKQQAALIQKVSDEVDLNRSTRRAVANEE